MAYSAGEAYLEVVPSFRGFVERIRAEVARVGSVDIPIGADTTALRAELAEVRRRLSALAGQSPTIRINTNAASAIAQLRGVQNAAEGARKPMLGLVEAIALVAPAAVPIAGAAGGALIGLLPTLAATVLGVSGIRDEFKSGALAGTQYGQDINALKTELGSLKAIAAGGILPGVSAGLAQSKPLFKEINTDVQIMSTHIGTAAGEAVPALLHVLTQLNPLFETFGKLVGQGAHQLAVYTQSSTGVSSFAAYAQAQLPLVAQFLGDVVTLVSHLVQAAAPLGGAVLGGVGLLVSTLNAIPVDVLRVLIPLLYAARLAMLGYRIVTAIVNAVSGAYTRLATGVQAYADRNNIASLQVQAAARANELAIAEEARVTAVARLGEAEAAQAAAAAQVVAAEEVSVAAATQARAQLTAAIQTTAAARTAANAAVTGATRASLAAEGSAARVVAAGRVSAIGWTSALGPIGALVLGLAFLGTAFLGSSDDTDHAAEANAAYAESVKQSTDALDAVNLAATTDQLSKQGALDQLDKLKASNRSLGLSYGDLARAVNGSQAEFDAVQKKIAAIAEAHNKTVAAGKGGTAGGYDSIGKSALALNKTLDTLHGTLGDNLRAQIALDQALKESQDLYLAGNPAAREAARSLGLTGRAYLTAAEAAKKNTQSTAEQTAAFQLENNAAGLLNQALDRMAGQSLSVAQAQTSLGQATRTATDTFAKNGSAIRGNSKAALANQQATQGQVQSARAAAEAIAKQTGSNSKAIASYKGSKKSLEDQLRAQGNLTPAVQRYINKLYDVKGVSDYLTKHPTKTDVKTAAAHAKLTALQRQITSIRQNRVPGIRANTLEAATAIFRLQRQINAMHGVDLSVNVTRSINTYNTTHTKALQAEGSILDFFVNGGVRRESHVAQIAPAGAYRLWAEPETGGEAYIPFAASKRARSPAWVGWRSS